MKSQERDQRYDQSKDPYAQINDKVKTTFSRHLRLMKERANLNEKATISKRDRDIEKMQKLVDTHL